MIAAARVPFVPSPEFMRRVENNSAYAAQQVSIARNIGRKAGWMLRPKSGDVTLRKVSAPKPPDPVWTDCDSLRLTDGRILVVQSTARDDGGKDFRQLIIEDDGREARDFEQPAVLA